MSALHHKYCPYQVPGFPSDFYAFGKLKILSGGRIIENRFRLWSGPSSVRSFRIVVVAERPIAVKNRLLVEICVVLMPGNKLGPVVGIDAGPVSLFALPAVVDL